MSILEEAWSIFKDPAHILAELGWEAATGLLLTWPFQVWLRRHDKKKHGGEREDAARWRHAVDRSREFEETLLVERQEYPAEVTWGPAPFWSGWVPPP